jgi:hypothetical protein
MNQKRKHHAISSILVSHWFKSVFLTFNGSPKYFKAQIDKIDKIDKIQDKVDRQSKMLVLLFVLIALCKYHSILYDR